MSLLNLKIEYEIPKKRQKKIKNKSKQKIIDNYYINYNNYLNNYKHREPSITWSNKNYIYLYPKRSFSI